MKLRFWRKKKRIQFQEKHKGIEKRWQILSPYLPNKSSWLLDVGSNLGDTCNRASALGHYVVGLEPDEVIFRRALENKNKQTAFFQMGVDPELIKTMPNFDAIFLLSVIHRIWAINGQDVAEKCLQALIEKTDLIFIEGSMRHQRYEEFGNVPPSFESNNLDECIVWHKEWLKKLIPNDTWEIIELGYVPHTIKEPHRPLFLLRKLK